MTDDEKRLIAVITDPKGWLKKHDDEIFRLNGKINNLVEKNKSLTLENNSERVYYINFEDENIGIGFSYSPICDSFDYELWDLDCSLYEKQRPTIIKLMVGENNVYRVLNYLDNKEETDLHIPYTFRQGELKLKEKMLAKFRKWVGDFEWLDSYTFTKS